MTDLIAKLRRCGIDDAADEIERLTAENAALREKVAAYEVVRLQLAERGDRYLHECVALRKDAERWRFALVHGFPFISLDSHKYSRDVWVHGRHQCLTANAAIDAAMEQSHE